MSKTQAFKAFELIMRCLLWVMDWMMAYPHNDAVHNKKEFNHIEADFIFFMSTDGKP